MDTVTTSNNEQWSSRWAFFLAATGSAVGLGNIWKFPYITGENGGGAFVLVYLLCIALIGIPVMMAEIMMGRRGQKNPIDGIRSLVLAEKASKAWKYIGFCGVLAGFLILSYYSVIAGEALAYVFRTFSGVFEGVTPEGAHNIYASLTGDPERLLAWHTVFMVMTMLIISRGVSHGLEKAVRFLMPALFVLLLVLVVYSFNTGDYFYQAVDFLFKADFSKLSNEAIFTAMGHAFFTLSLGMGAIMVYGSYLPKGVSIAKISIAIATADTLIALLAGLVLFPLIFANNLEPSQGPGLIFETLPLAFGHMQGGLFFGGLFFLLLVVAAWTSAISLVEPAVAWLTQNTNISRRRAAVYTGSAAWLLGLLTVISFNVASDVTFFDKTFFGLFDYLTSNILLPLGGLAMAIFSGWVMTRDSVKEELAIAWPIFFHLWLLLIRYIAPLAIFIIFLKVIGLWDYFSLSTLFNF